MANTSNARDAIAVLAAHYGLIFTCTETGVAVTDGWEHYTFDVVIRRGHKVIRIPFETGRGRTRSPDVADVLSSLISDASGADQSFEEWASHHGLDTDSRKAEATWRACRKTAERLASMFSEAERRRLEALCSDF